MQEMKLLEGAYDGDVEGVRSILTTGVPVDATYPVRLFNPPCMCRMVTVVGSVCVSVC